MCFSSLELSPSIAGILFGLAPALQTSRLDLRSMLNEATRGSTGSARQQQVRSTLVVVEVALALVLLIGAGLLIRSFPATAGSSAGI